MVVLIIHWNVSLGKPHILSMSIKPIIGRSGLSPKVFSQLWLTIIKFTIFLLIIPLIGLFDGKNPLMVDVMKWLTLETKDMKGYFPFL